MTTTKQLLVTVAVLLLFACNQPTNKLEMQEMVTDEQSLPEKNMITNQIVYDVIIHDPNEEAWWYQNMKTENREKFVHQIIESVKNGKLTAYKPKIGMPTNTSEDALSIDEFNLLLESEKDIARITFIEEWYFDSEQLKMGKKVKGIALSKGVYAEDGLLKGYQRLFYVWFEKTELLDIS